MTRKPGSPADDDRETPGGRAAERRREHLAARYGENGAESDETDTDEPESESGESDESDQESESDPGPGDAVDRP